MMNRTIHTIHLAFSSILLLLILSCGGGGDGTGASGKSPDASGTGAVTFQLRIVEPQTQSVSLMAAEFDCTGNGITTIVVEVRDDGANQLIATGGPWACEAGEGRVSGVLAGASRSLKAFAIDADGLVIFTGEVRGITVVAGQTTAVGVVFLTKVSNRPPVMSFIPAQTVDEGETLEFPVAASDPDIDDILTYGVSGLPNGAEFDSGSGRFTWTPGFADAGNYRVMFIATDDGSPPLSDSREVTITVGNVNRPPVLDPVGNRAASEGVELKFTVTGSDPDPNDTLSFTGSDLPQGARFDAETREFSWTPDLTSAGNYFVLFAVTDNGVPPLADSEQIAITVGDVIPPPVLDPIGNRRVDENVRLEFRVTGRSPVGHTVTFGASDLPADSEFNPTTQVFAWTPDFGDAGNYAVTFTIVDTTMPSLRDSETIIITVGDMNQAPVLDPVGNPVVTEGVELAFTVTGRDPDNHNLTFSAAGVPPSAQFNPSSQTFRWQTGVGDAGTYPVIFTLTDDGSPSLSDSETVTITVLPENPAPVLAPIGNRSANTVLEQSFFFPVAATDPNGNNLTFGAGPLPGDAVFALNPNGAGYVFDWFPTSNDIGTYTVRFTVTDDGVPPQSDFEDVMLTVGTNSPPRFTQVSDGVTTPVPVPPAPTIFVFTGQTLNLTVTATDFENHALTYSGSGPAGAVFNPPTRTLTWTPAAAQAGTTQSASFQVTDNGEPSGSDSLTVTIQVLQLPLVAAIE